MLLKMGRGHVPPARPVRRSLSPPTAAPAGLASHAHRSAGLSPVFVNEAPGFSPSGLDEVIDLLLLGIHPEQDRHRPARVGRYVVQAIHGLDRFADPSQSEG